MIDFKANSEVTFEIIKRPENAQAEKTLIRLMSKDKANQLENKRLLRVRKANQEKTTRGGRYRLWSGRIKKQHPVTVGVGKKATIKLTLDILKDLKSVEKFLNIKSV